MRLGGLLALVVWAWLPAHAQGAAQGGSGVGSNTVKRGNFLKPEQYATQAAQTLFVDGVAGSDSTTCTSTGAGACATIAGAVNKLPKLIRHPVTITIAAGNYTGVNLFDFQWDPADLSAGAYISFVGSQTNFSPATGTATGTVTSVGGGTYSTTAGTLTCINDTGQSWTADDLAGRLLSLTGGTGVGQIFPIYSNTATRVCVTGIFSPLPIAGTTYAIITPAVVVNTGVNQPRLAGVSVTTAGNPSGFNIANSSTVRFSSGDATIAFTDIDVSVTAASTRAITLAQTSIAFLRCRLTTTAAATIAVQVDANSRFTATDSVLISSSYIAVALGRQATQVGIGMTLTRAFVRGGAAGIVANSAAASTIISGGLVIEVTSASGIGWAATQGSFSNMQSTPTNVVRCTGSAATSGTGFSAQTDVSTGASTTMATLDHYFADSCAYGVKISGPGASVYMRNGVFLSNTTAISISNGGRFVFGGAGNGFTTNGTDVAVDSTSATFAALSALSPSAIHDLSTGSKILFDSSLP